MKDVQKKQDISVQIPTQMWSSLSESNLYYMSAGQMSKEWYT